jgi:large subunit ribosomal protein L4
MKEIPVLDMNGQHIGKETLEIDTTCGVNADILHRYVVAYLANQRQGNASTKTRGEVSGSGRKPWRQKGTGRARVGSTRNPVWRHGGIVFGPKKNRDYRQDLPEKMKRRALQDALKSRIVEDRMMLLEMALASDSPSTKVFTLFLKKAGFGKAKILFVLDKKDARRMALVKSLRNIANTEYCYADQLNPYGVLRNDLLIAQKEAFPQLKQSLGVAHA